MAIGECFQEPKEISYELRLQALEQEVERQGRALSSVASSLSERAHSLQTLKTQIAVMMATWQSEFRGNLSKVIDRIDTAGQTEDYWRIVRRQVELAQPDFVEHVAKHSKILTTTESKICLLIGLNLSSPEIASVLNISDRTVSNYRSRIRKKLSATETRFARLFQATAA